MSWTVLIAFLLLELANMPREVPVPDSPPAAPAAPSAEDLAAKLRWKNLEVISGELREASATEFSWQSPLFEEPLRLRWDSIRGIDQPVSNAAASEVFSVVLRDGSHLLGDLVGINADAVSIKSVRHGEVALKRSEVLLLRRLRGGKIIAAGPSGDIGWTLDEPTTSGQPVPPSTIRKLITGPGGVFAMPYWNAKATLGIKTPDRAEVDIDLRFAEFPAFAFRFDGDASKGIRLETWDDELVIAHGDEFELVRKIGKDEREVSVRIRWDRKEKKGALFSASGDLLSEWVFTGDFGESTDWSLHNKGRDLTLAQFRVREWNGNLPAKFDATKPRIDLADGRVSEGSVVEASADVLKISEDSGGAASSCAVADVAEIIFSTDAPKPDADAPTFTFADGTLCHGRVVSIAEGRVALETGFTSAPLSISMAGLRQIRMSKGQPNEPDAAQDEISLDSAKLHGTLTAIGDGRIHWLPVGGVNSAVPKPAASLKVTRALPPDAVVPSAPALFYTTFGDIIPGTFRGLAGDAVEIESDMVETKTLPASSLDAVQFGDVTQASVQGFDAPGWHIVKGDERSVRVSKEHLEIDPGGAFGHPFVLQSDEIRFSLEPGDSTSLRLRLFSAGMNSERTTNLVVATNGGNIYVGVENNDGEMNRWSNASAEPSKLIAVKVEIRDASVVIYIGDRQIYQAPFDAKRRAGSGLIIEPGNTFGDGVSPVKLAGFSTSIARGRTWVPEINPEMKAQALTVPRFRKERPPHHALIATNGDVLRGEIEATTATHFGFLSGLEKLRIPRSRVNTAIWLKPPRKDATPDVEKPPTELLLDKAFTRNINYGGASLSTLLSAFAREIPGIKFNDHTKDRDRRKVSFSFSTQPVREALDRLCGLFSMRYRVEENGSITLETGPEPTEKFIEKGYWLKGDAFPDADSAQKRLVKNGIEFPEGTSAQWNAATRQLTVKHTVGTHAKIAEFLKKEFGASYAVLTHWLLLTNGARLGLSVEKFEKDLILGYHPEYGRCQVPMPLVFTIQTSKPVATGVMRSFADWRLTSAREPVIAESGGESSPTLGKQAETFKIPLLTGGDFDLQAERGKVVVLDFWATWCAPCIKSLPGLIDAISAFPDDRVKLIGVNQGESNDTVKRFIETRDWKLTVAMDANQKVAQQYGVTGIPHTVIVGPDGKIAWVKTGYSPESPTEAAQAIKTLLSASSSQEPKSMAE
jgi:peroxiredoxin